MVYRRHDVLAIGQCEELLSIVDEIKMIAIAPEGEGGAGVGIFHRRVEGAEPTLLIEVLGISDDDFLQTSERHLSTPRISSNSAVVYGSGPL